jgi:hypothetical protein
MARTGRPRKVATPAQGHREHTALVPVAPQPVGRFIVPVPPLSAAGVTLLPETLQLWDAYWLAPIARALDGVAGIDRALVDDWIRLENELLVVECAVQEARVVDGSRQQPRPHPLLAERHSIRGELKWTREQLGIGPANRARLGIAIGEERLTAERLNDALNRASGTEDAIEANWSEVVPSVADLRREAAALGIAGRSKMRRAQLVEAIEEAS